MWGLEKENSRLADVGRDFFAIIFSKFAEKFLHL
jgi:hypothetical protein